MVLDSIESIKCVASKLPISLSNVSKIAGILLKQCERTNRIIVKCARESIANIIRTHSHLIMAVLQSIVQAGNKNCNRLTRQICIDLVKIAIESCSDQLILTDIINTSSTYVKSSASDSCNVVRDTARCIIENLRNIQNYPSAMQFKSENIRPSPVNRLKLSSCPKMSEIKNDPAPIVKKSKAVMGKAQRVKIVP